VSRRLSRIAAGAACAAALLLAAPAGASRGTIVVATDATNAPFAFTAADGGMVRGVDADLARAIANVLGYRVRIVAASPGAIVPGLGSGEYDLGMSLADTPARERVVDVVTYASARCGAGKAPCGVAVAKGSGLTGEVLTALRTIFADGTYDSILARWHARASAVAAPRLDPATAGR
jgi:polar amino acid transport system substrate-binding protein